MANYNVGNIEVGVISSTSEVASDIDKLIKTINKIERLDKAIQDSFVSINKLSNGLFKLQRINLDNLTGKFDKISSATQILNEKLSSIKNPNFEDTANALNKLGNAFRQFDKMKNFDFRNMYNSFNSINRIITPFLQKLKDSEASLVAMDNVLKSLKTKTITKANEELDKVNNQTKKIKNNSDKAKKNFNQMFSIGKIYFFMNYFKRVGVAFANILNASIDFEETLNKFQVSFGEFSNQAESFATRLAYAFNLSRESLFNYMSTFNSMLKSSSEITTTQAYNISKTLTQLALDYSSLFNVTVETAMTSFQSVLSGQIRTIRSVSGIDVSENTIFQYYQELGGTKSMRQLSQLQKKLLKIYALEKQMDSLGAIGDLEKTVNSISNVTKQLKETIQELFVYIGNIAQKLFKPLLTNILGVTLALKDMSKALASSIGALTTEYENDSANKLFGSIEEGAEDATDSVNELLGTLSFDKFEALTKSTTQTDDLEKIINAIALYETNFANVKSRAREIADEILKWLGYLPQVNDETGEIEYKLKDGYTRLDAILDVLKIIVSLGIYTLMAKAGNALTSLIGQIITTDKSLKSLSSTIGNLSKLGIITSLFILIKGLEDGDKALIAIGTSLLTVFSVIKMIHAFNNVEKLKGLIEQLKSVNKTLSKTKQTFIGVGLGLALVGAGVVIFTQMDKWSAKTKILVGVLGTLTASLVAAATAYLALRSAMSWGTAVPIIVGATVAGAATIWSLVKGIKQYKDGGIVEQGQMFIANEAGAELVGSFDGKTGVANNQMIVNAIEEASYRGFMRAMAQNENQTNVNLNVQGVDSSAVARALFNPLIEEARRNGYNVSKS